MVSGVPMRDMRIAMRHADPRTPASTTWPRTTRPACQPPRRVLPGRHDRLSAPAGGCAKSSAHPTTDITVPAYWRGMRAPRAMSGCRGPTGSRRSLQARRQVGVATFA
jgi:hypothetical protein